MEQNYSTHRRWVPMYHFVLSLTLLLTIIGAAINLYKSVGTTNLYSASLLLVLSVAALVIFFFMRAFPIKAQDRVIRLEENFRHHLMDGKLLDSKLTMRQIVGLRFAADEEFLELEKKAVAENMSENEIKKAIKNWKADTERV